MEPDRDIAMLSGEHDNVVLTERERQVVVAIELALLRDDPLVDNIATSPLAVTNGPTGTSRVKPPTWISPAHGLVVIGGLLIAAVLVLLLFLA